MGGKRIKIPIICKQCGIDFFTIPCRVKKDVKFCSYKCHNEYRKSIPFSVRFWDKVDKTDSCWNWTAFKNKAGYGQFHHEVNYKTYPILAHRYSYFLHFGEIPKDLLVLHKCDNPKCVNPNHLFIGTTQDNMTDRGLKNRTASGIKSGYYTKPESRKIGISGLHSKLTENDIVEIRNMNKTQLQIAKIYNVSEANIWSIINRKTWKYVV